MSLRTQPVPLIARLFIIIGSVNNNHIIEVHLRNGYPVPLLVYKWHENRLPIAEGWDTAYKNGLHMYSNLFSSSNIFDDTINIY